MQIQTTDKLSNYYARRASEYERIYAKPERQQDLALLHALLPQYFARRTVLEVACGTAYWTGKIAQSAKSVHAVDVNDEVLRIAQNKPYPHDNVTFARADAYSLDAVGNGFDAGFAAFWWSHIPKSRIRGFLAGFHKRLAPGALVLFLDNVFVAGSSTPLSHEDGEGNTYQMRSLDDGSRHEVLKNFPPGNELLAVLGPYSDHLKYRELPYYWLVSYRLKVNHDA